MSVRQTFPTVEHSGSDTLVRGEANPLHPLDRKLHLRMIGLVRVWEV